MYQFPPARILFLIFIYIVSFFQESQNNGAPQILFKKNTQQLLPQRDRLGRAGAQDEGQDMAGSDSSGPCTLAVPRLEGGSTEVPALLTTHWPHLRLRLQALQAKVYLRCHSLVLIKLF